MHIENIDEFEPASGARLYVAPGSKTANETLAINSEAFESETWDEVPVMPGGTVRMKEVDTDLFRALAGIRDRYSLRFFLRTQEGEAEEIEFGGGRDAARESAHDAKIRELKERVGKKRQ